MYYTKSKRDFFREKKEREALDRELKWLEKLLQLFQKKGKIPKKEEVDET